MPYALPVAQPTAPNYRRVQRSVKKIIKHKFPLHTKRLVLTRIMTTNPRRRNTRTMELMMDNQWIYAHHKQLFCQLLKVKRLKTSKALNGKPITELRSVTCPMGSHSVTCHPTQVNVPRLNPSQPGRYSIYLSRRDGRLSWPRQLDSGLTGNRTHDCLIASPMS